MRKTLPILLLLSLTTAVGARAEPILYSAVLLGPSESPPNTSPGFGFSLVQYDPDSHMLEILAGFAGLTAPVTAAHIHCCVDPPGIAGVATPVPLFPGFPTGVMSGFYEHAFDLTDAMSFNPAFVMANGGTPLAAELALAGGLSQGMAYFNIHTTEFPAGEIRGFLQRVNGGGGGGPGPIPEPATLLLVGSGAAMAWIGRRRRRK
jgi:CHRD domain-containing protein/PEP-CTERM motif-containing protein